MNQKLQILYVEDHSPAQMLMEAIIDELTDFELLLANDGKQAQALLSEHRPALYILDMDLPDTNGMELGEALNAIHPAPVILVSAYAEAIKTGTLTDTIHYYLGKPLDPDNVVETIRRALT